MPADDSGGEPEVEVDITASAASLAPSDRILLRVVALGPDVSTELAHHLCFNGTEPGEIPPPARELIKTSDPDSIFRVLYWGESAPDSRGETEADASLRVAPEYTHICVYAALQTREGEAVEDRRFARAIMDLRNAPSEVEPTEQPSPETSPEP